jgi:hypothetical protein
MGPTMILAASRPLDHVRSWPEAAIRHSAYCTHAVHVPHVHACLHHMVPHLGAGICQRRSTRAVSNPATWPRARIVSEWDPAFGGDRRPSVCECAVDTSAVGGRRVASRRLLACCHDRFRVWSWLDSAKVPRRDARCLFFQGRQHLAACGAYDHARAAIRLPVAQASRSRARGVATSLRRVEPLLRRGSCPLPAGERTYGCRPSLGALHRRMKGGGAQPAYTCINYSSWAVGRNTSSLTSTSSGWLIANATMRA